MTQMTASPRSGAAQPTAERRLFSVRETCASLAVGSSTLYRLIAKGDIKARKINGKTVFTAEEIERFVASLPEA
jgi:excisionase family DNA binding protein